MSNPPPLEYDTFYHIYNRGTNGENLFLEKRNYHYFLSLYQKYVVPVADTYTFCLMGNHFHFLIKTKPYQKQASIDSLASKLTLNTSLQFSHLFNAYAKAINKTYQRSGSLFEHPFHRVMVTDNNQFRQTVLYIHLNPRKHKFVDDFRLWQYSSYPLLIADTPTFLCRNQLIDFFDNLGEFEKAHLEYEHGASWRQVELEENF